MKSNPLFDALVAIASAPIPVTDWEGRELAIRAKEVAKAAIVEGCEVYEDPRLLATMSATLACGILQMGEERWDDATPPERNEIAVMAVNMAKAILEELKG